MGPRLVLATHNEGKRREIEALLAPFGVEVLSADALGLAEPEETEDSFVGNARIKAHAAARATGLPALADDSGLEVDALGGDPGVRTADWAETPDGRDFAVAMRKVEERMPEGAPRTARFRATLCLAWPDGRDAVFEGAVEGRLVWPPRGENGFGYDPMFVPGGQTGGAARTFGEMTREEKGPLTHRAAAFVGLAAWLTEG